MPCLYSPVIYIFLNKLFSFLMTWICSTLKFVVKNDEKASPLNPVENNLIVDYDDVVEISKIDTKNAFLIKKNDLCSVVLKKPKGF